MAFFRGQSMTGLPQAELAATFDALSGLVLAGGYVHTFPTHRSAASARNAPTLRAGARPARACAVTTSTAGTCFS